MKSLFEKFHLKSKKNTPPLPTLRRVDTDKLSHIVNAVPVGGNFHYYPEYKNEIVLETVVLAYYVNGIFVYSNSDLLVDNQNGRFMVRNEGQWVELINIKEFSLVIPAEPDSIDRLNYDQKAIIGRLGGLITGNHITVVAHQAGAQSPTVEAMVKRRLELKRGHYAGAKVAMLDLDVDSFKFFEKRKHARIQTRIPADVARESGGRVLVGEMVDYAEKYARFRLNENTASIGSRGSLVISITPSRDSGEVVFRGHMLRHHENEAVLRLDEIMKQGQFVELAAVDMLQLKSALLQNPNTLLGS